MVKRILYEFPHSHFCEKARWALDYKGLEFRRVALLPPWHILKTKRYGKQSSVPLLLDGERPVQGSGKIISYLDEVYPESLLTKGDNAECVKKEKYLDNEIGVPLRALFYYYSLKYKDFVTAAFVQNSPRWQRIIFEFQYPLVARLIKKSYCPTEESALQAGKKLLAALDQVWRDLDGKLYLHKDGFGRLDIAVCSLLSFVARPPEIPIVVPQLPKDPLLSEWDQRIRSHPLIGWIQEIYRLHRTGPFSQNPR